VITTHLDRYFHGVPAHLLQILRRMNVPVLTFDEIAADEGLLSASTTIDLIIDAIIGNSLSGAPSGAAAELIRWSNKQSAPTLSLESPSGIDATSGQVFDPSVRASATLTLALPKVGLKKCGASQFVGELYLADISIPPAL
jgi:NAD(P)H-hydrate epimerase